MHAKWFVSCVLCALAFVLPQAAAAQTPTPGQNVNMVAGREWPGGDPFLQRQNEPTLALSTRNPLHMLAGANDYRTVDLPNLGDQLPNGGTLTGDAWLGLFKSFNGGQTWQSTLIPGYPQDQTQDGRNSPLYGFTTASDPVVRAGTNGLFYYAGIVFDRNSPNKRSAVFVSRFVDLNNRENGNAAPAGPAADNTDPIRYNGTKIVESVDGSVFLDKPWIAVDVPRAGAAACNLQVSQPGGVVAQSFPAGTVYIVYTKFFLDGAGNPKYSQLMFSRSTDCGSNWSAPIAAMSLDEWNKPQKSLHQGATLAIDPQAGLIYLSWRRFKTTHFPDSIIIAASIDRGKTLLPGIPVVTLPPYSAARPYPSFFDNQRATTTTAFRTNAFPTLAVDDSGIKGWPGRVYLAWSQRMDPDGLARIMMLNFPGSLMLTSGGLSLTPKALDQAALLDDTKPTANSFARGHQFMPQMTFTGGKLLVVYYDLRLDHTLATYQLTGQSLLESRTFVPVDSNGDDSAPMIFNPVIDDATIEARRHTLDLVVAEANPAFVPAFTIARVSRYKAGALPGNTTLQQLQVNPPNLPLFKDGTVPFFGDYIDVAGQMFRPKDGSWVFNTAPLRSPTHVAVWTTNQDVRPPPDHDWTNYTPPFPTATGNQTRGSVFDPTREVPPCQPRREGMRNQNIYSARITEGLAFFSPQNSKPLSAGVQRAFALILQNTTSVQKSFRLTITNQRTPTFWASFVQATNTTPLPPLPDPTLKLDVTVGSRAGIARTVFAVSSNPTASITVTADEITAPGGDVVGGGLSSFVVLNADATVPSLIDPEGAPAGSDITDTELYNPDVANPDVANPNESKSAITNPDVANPDVANPDVANPDVANPDVANPDVANPNVANPDVANPDVANPLVSDATYPVTNTGNTTASYTVKLIGTGPDASAHLQVILNKTYKTPVSVNCVLGDENQNTLQANALHPLIRDPSDVTDPDVANPDVANTTLALAPGETALITVRGNVDLATMQQIIQNVTPVVVAQAANTGSATPSFSAPLTITTATLPDAFIGQGYKAALRAIGGKPPYQWSLANETSLPAGLRLGSDGTISDVEGVSAEAGKYSFTVRVTDSSGKSRLRDLAINVVSRLGILTPSIEGLPGFLPTAYVGSSYSAQPQAQGGAPKYVWSQSGLPKDMQFSTGTGLISGTPSAPAGATVQLSVKDSGQPPQQASAALDYLAVRCYPELALPAVEYVGNRVFETPQGVFIEHDLSVTNTTSFPDDLFVNTPRFGPCQPGNPSPARTWVDIFDPGVEFGGSFNTYCALGAAKDMTAISFTVPVNASPASVEVRLSDRACVDDRGLPQTYISRPVQIPRP